MTQTVPDISPLMPMHQDPLLVYVVMSFTKLTILALHPICSALLQIMALRLFGTKPLSKSILITVNWSLRNILKWNFNQNTKLFIHKNASENIFCEMVPILFGREMKKVPRFVLSTVPGDGLVPTDTVVITIQMSRDPGSLNPGTKRSRVPGCWDPRIHTNTGAGDTVLANILNLYHSTGSWKLSWYAITVILCQREAVWVAAASGNLWSGALHTTHYYYNYWYFCIQWP